MIEGDVRTRLHGEHRKGRTDLIGLTPDPRNREDWLAELLEEAMAQRDGRCLMTGGLVLVRQRPGSTKGVMFTTLEDETGIVNEVVWLTVFERQRRVGRSATTGALNGKIQREGMSCISLRRGFFTCPKA